MLPEFVTLHKYVDPGSPPDGWTSGARTDYTTVETDVAPDNVASVHSPLFDRHENDQTPLERRRAYLSRATGPEYIIHTMDGDRHVTTEHGRVDLCHVTLNDGSMLTDIVGTRVQVRERLRPPACPVAAATGITINVTTGVYTLSGDCGGTIELAAADAAFVLDPRRLAGDEWVLMKARNGNTRNYRFQVLVGASASFTVQQWVPGHQISTPGAWRDLAGTNSIQAETRLRPKP